MSLEVEVVSDSGKARKDLKALEDAINNIKKVAANFSFNPFSDKNRDNIRKAAEDINRLKENSKVASTHFNRLVPDAKSVSDSIKNVSQSYEKTAKHAESIAKDTKNINSNLSETNKQSSALEKTTNAAADAFKSLVVQIGATATAYLSMKTYLSASDTTTSINSKITIATKTQAEFNSALRETRDIAINTRGRITEVTDLYTKLSLATQNFNRSQEDVGRVTATVAKAVALSGSSADSAAAAVMQLGQAFSSGILQGDELRSISENASQLMRTIADGFGKTIGQVRQLGTEGKLTSDKLFQSILSQAEIVDGKFSKIGITFSQAFANISSSALILFAELEKVLSGGGGSGGGGGGSKGLPFYINSIAVEIAKFAENIGFNITLLKVKAFLLLVDIRKFLSEPFDIKLKTARLAIEDILPSQNEIYSTITNAVVNAKHFMSSVMGAISPTRRASGGYISGPGTSTSDSIPAMLSNGEFVVNAEATRKNLKLLNLINSGAIKHFAKGGEVSDTSNAENWLYRSIPQKATIVSPLPVEVVSQSPEVTRTRERLLFDKVQDSLVNFFKQAAANIRRVTDPAFAKASDGLDYFVERLEKWIPGLTRAIDIFKSMSGIGPYTGGGPQRNSEQRMLGHDFINTFIPVRAQIPVLATVTAAAGALIALSTSGTLRSVLLGLLTTAFGLAVGGTVYDSEIKRVNGLLMKTGLDIVQSMTSALFGSGIFGDRGFGGTLSLIAKMSLLFASGRAFMGNAAIGLATAPTTLANSTALAAQSWYASRATARVQREVEEMEKVAVRLKEQKDTTFKELSAFNSNGIRVGPANARIISGGVIPQSMQGLMPGVGQRGTYAQREFMDLAGSARNAAEALELHKRTQEQQTKELKKHLDALRSHSDGLQAAVRAQRENFKAGIINTAGGIGGTFGALGGFNIGMKAAEGMKDADDWQKSLTIVTSTMLGQAILAGIGSISATIAVAVFGWAAPTLLVIGAITASVAAIAALYKNWDTVVDKLNKVLNDQVPLWLDIGKQWTKQLANFVLDTIGAPKADSKFVSEFKANGGFKPNAPYGIHLDPEKNPTANSIVTIASNIGASILDNLAALFLHPEKILKAYIDALPLPSGQGALKKAFGGYISGPGTGTSDSIPALLSNGEFVINAEATKNNLGLLQSINNNRGVRRFANGGLASNDDNEFYDAAAKVIEKEGLIGVAMRAARYSSKIPSDNSNKGDSSNAIKSALNDLLRMNTGFNPLPESENLSRSFQSTMTKPAVAAYTRDGTLDNTFNNLKDVLIGTEITQEKLKAFEELKKYTRDSVKSELVSSITAGLTLSLAGIASKGSAKYLDMIVNQRYSSQDPGIFFGGLGVMGLKAISLLSKLFSVENQIPVVQGVSRGMRLSDKYNQIPDKLSNWLLGIEELEFKQFTPIKQFFDKFIRFQDDAELAEAFGGQKPPKHANGGFISGPGTGTSDSIPALLSNGEFVINAEATRRNFTLLDAINSGKTVSRFAKGGVVTLDSNISRIADAEAIAKGLESALVKAVIMVESQGNASARNPNSGATGLMQLMAGTAKDLRLIVDSTKDERLDAAKNIAAGTEYLKQQIKTFGTLDKALAAYNWGPGNLAKNLDSQGNIKRLPIETKEYIEAVRMHAGLPAMDRDYETFGVSRKVQSPWRGRTNQVEGTAIGGGVDWSVFPFGLGERLSKIDFSKWPGGELIVEAFSWIAKNFLSKAKIATDALDVLGGSKESAAKAINEIGFNGKEYKASDFNKLDKADIEALRAAVTTIKTAKSPTNELQALEYNSVIKSARSVITSILDKTEKAKPLSERLGSGTTIQAIETLNEAFRGNTQYLLGLTAYSKLSSEDMNRLIAITENVEEINKRAASLDEFGRDQANKLIKELWRHADEILSRVNAQPSNTYVERPSADASKAGTTFATSFQNEVTVALAAVLRGKERFSSLGKAILERITGGILDNVSKGFINALFAKTNLGDKLSEWITSVFSFGEKSGGGLGDIFNNVAEAFKAPQVTHGNIIDPKDAVRYASALPYTKSSSSDHEQTFSYDFTSLKASVDTGLSNVVSSVDTSGVSLLDGITGLGGVFSSIISGIGTGVSSLFSFLGFSDGGPVYGAGTGTSDSIPAMLSNGEFVVNARATNRYRGLLESINKGAMPHFADGGYVASMPTLGLLESKANSQHVKASASNTAVFNINITGDISSQTRKQVMSMIPEIAAGTNAHNREINYNRK